MLHIEQLAQICQIYPELKIPLIQLSNLEDQRKKIIEEISNQKILNYFQNKKYKKQINELTTQINQLITQINRKIDTKNTQINTFTKDNTDSEVQNIFKKNKLRHYYDHRFYI